MRSLLLLVFTAGVVSAADWPQFRGPDGAAKSPAALPTEWARAKKADAKKTATTAAADKNIAWVADIPGTGWAQPVVVGNTVFVNTVVTDPPHVPPKEVPKDVTCDWQVVCLDLNTGKQLWATSVAKGKPKHGTHPGNTFATETGCADGERVYAFFGHAGVLAALDHTGKEVWRTEVGQYGAGGSGFGASPALHDGKVFVPLLNDQKGVALCLDAKTGKELWRADQGKAGASWASLLVWKNSVRTELVVCGHSAVTGHDLTDGKELWRVGGFDAGFASSPTASGDVLAFGNGRSAKNNALTAVKAGAKGDITLKDGEKANEHVLFAKTGCSPNMSSPLAADGLLYVNQGGALACYDLTTGKEVYKENLRDARQFVASPLVADGHVYLTDEAGKTFVVTAGREFELVAENPVGDMVWACAAAADGKLLIRGLKGLYCVGK
jgi:outer membrane protein assembly factor BamB